MPMELSWDSSLGIAKCEFSKWKRGLLVILGLHVEKLSPSQHCAGLFGPGSGHLMGEHQSNAAANAPY